MPPMGVGMLIAFLGLMRIFFFAQVEEKIALFCFVACEGKDEGEGFIGRDPDTEGARVRSDQTALPAEDRHRYTREGVVILIEQFPGYDGAGFLLGKSRQGQQHRRQGQGSKYDSQRCFVYDDGKVTVKLCI